MNSISETGLLILAICDVLNSEIEYCVVDPSGIGCGATKYSGIGCGATKYSGIGCGATNHSATKYSIYLTFLFLHSRHETYRQVSYTMRHQ